MSLWDAVSGREVEEIAGTFKTAESWYSGEAAVGYLICSYHVVGYVRADQAYWHGRYGETLTDTPLISDLSSV